MNAEQLALSAEARALYEQAMTQAAPHVRRVQRTIEEAAPLLHAIERVWPAMERLSPDLVATQRALDASGVLSMLSSPTFQRALRSIESATAAAEQSSLIALPTDVHPPEDDSARLREQLAQKDVEIAWLKAELRTYRLAEAFGSGEEHQLFPPSDN